MPVLMDIDLRDHHLFRGNDKDRAKAKPASSRTLAGCINLGLINNMPDSALVSTERQIFEVLNAAAGDLPVRLQLYTLQTAPRSDWGRQYMSRFYSDVGVLWNGQIDGLIVTGAEPQAPNLPEEPYWGQLGKVIDWAKENTVSAAWSCLAVHGAVLHVDGIDRHGLSEKCFGVFEQTRTIEHPLMQGVPSKLKVPHSRWNEVREDALSSGGYTVLTKSAEAGVDIFVKQQKGSLFVYFQGHPEYEAQSLLGEYRRDVGRFLRHEIESYPTMPRGYFDDETVELLTAFQKRVLSDRHGEQLASFPADRIAATLTNTWHSDAAHIYRNWLLYMSEHKSRRSGRPGTARARRSATCR
ncbi:MAG TPA: homoserine O-succinyltransferase [Xanthobacteraceae bacterium]|nr:homoserine O-succinyltransferase [Xanthobacteraceae bacterium]